MRSDDPTASPVSPADVDDGRARLEFECQQLREIIGVIPNMLFWKDRAGAYVGCNETAAAMLAMSADELAGKTDLDLPLPEAQARGYMRDDRRVLETGVPMPPKEEDFVTAEGEARVLMTRKIPMRDVSGEVVGVLGLSEDITERKRAELEMLLFNQRLVQATGELEAKGVELERARRDAEAANEKAQSANRAKTEFLANMSHEIRTPMAAILGFADLLREQGDNAELREKHIETIRRNGEHLMSIINGVLDLSKIEAGRMDVEQLPFDPAIILSDVVTLMRVRAEEKGLELTLRSNGPIPRRVLSDPLRFRQVVINLVSNAIKFTDAGKVEIVCDLVEEDADGLRMLRVLVHDTGIGIEPSAQVRLFESFEQADSSTTRRYGGSGLGLAISRSLVHMLGGSIRYSSMPGQGSTFCIVIDPGIDADTLDDEDFAPITPIAVDAAPREIAPTPRPKLTGHVLLAEDGADNRRLIAHHLESAGLQVTHAETGLAAVEQVEGAGKFDVVLMDMQMPVMDGYGATRRLRELGHELPIIALTAHAMAGDRERCLAAGCSDYLTKPVSVEALLAALGPHLAGGSREVEALPEPGGTLFSTFTDDPAMADLVTEYVAELPPQVGALLAELDVLRSGGDPAQLKRIVHQLKGAGGGYGFAIVTDHAKAAEARIIEGAPPAEIRTGVERLIATLRRIDGYDTSAEQPAAAA